MIKNRTYDEIKVGDSACLKKTLTRTDIALFAGISGDINPAHLDREYARSTPFGDIVAHGLWSGALISNVLGTELPGPGTIYLSQSFSFQAPVKIGDELTVKLTVLEKKPQQRVVLECHCTNQNGESVLSGRAEVIAPDEKVSFDAAVPELLLTERGYRLETLITRAKSLPPLLVAVAHPVDENSIRGAVEAHRQGLITAMLVGNLKKIRSAAAAADMVLDDVELIEAPHSHAAAEVCVQLARQQKVQAIMKGALHTDEILKPVVNRSSGLRTDRRISHVFVMDAPAYAELLFVTDAAINIKPDLMTKRDIVQNAADLGHALGLPTPRVAVLSAVETVYPPIASTVDAAALCKMADRKQITGCLIDGPLAFDNAISPEAVAAKGIHSDVAGRADILIVPDLEAGNMLAKQLDYLGGAVAAGIALGAQVPLILTSRAEKTLPRLASCALASLYVNTRTVAGAGA